VRVTVELKDGRTVDITDRPPDEAVALLRAKGVRLGDIRNTWHVVRSVHPRASGARRGGRMTLRYAVTFEFDSRPPLTVQGIGAVCMDIL
jgi:hypothetical protein